MQKLPSVCYMKKEIQMPGLYCKIQLNPLKTNNYPNDPKWRKRKLTLLKGITSKHDGYFYYLNCLYSFRTEKKT